MNPKQCRYLDLDRIVVVVVSQDILRGKHNITSKQHELT